MIVPSEWIIFLSGISGMAVASCWEYLRGRKRYKFDVDKHE